MEMVLMKFIMMLTTGYLWARVERREDSAQGNGGGGCCGFGIGHHKLLLPSFLYCYLRHLFF